MGTLDKTLRVAGRIIIDLIKISVVFLLVVGLFFGLTSFSFAETTTPVGCTDGEYDLTKTGEVPEPFEEGELGAAAPQQNYNPPSDNALITGTSSSACQNEQIALSRGCICGYVTYLQQDWIIATHAIAVLLIIGSWFVIPWAGRDTVVIGASFALYLAMFQMFPALDIPPVPYQTESTAVFAGLSLVGGIGKHAERKRSQKKQAEYEIREAQELIQGKKGNMPPTAAAAISVANSRLDRSAYQAANNAAQHASTIASKETRLRPVIDQLRSMADAQNVVNCNEMTRMFKEAEQTVEDNPERTRDILKRLETTLIETVQQKADPLLEEAEELRTDGNPEAGRTVYETVQELLDYAADVGSEETHYAFESQQERAERGIIECEMDSIERTIDRVVEEIDTAEPRDLLSTLEDVFDKLDRIEGNSPDKREIIQRLEDIREKAVRADLQAQLEESRTQKQEADSFLQEAEYYDARDLYNDVQDDLEGALAAANKRGFNEIAADISLLIRQCSQGAEDALTAMSSQSDGDEALDRPTVGVSGPLADDDTVTLGEKADELPEHEVIERLGSGGHADVHKVRLVESGEIGALKIPRWQGTLSMEITEQFQSEAATWENIDSHENIVTVLDSGTRPYPWLLLEYMGGGNLGERIGTADLETAMNILVEVCKGIRHAHRHGIVHSDLKPQNILFSQEGHPRIADWGLAQVMLEHSTSIEGMTPGYAAPEQLDPDKYGGVDNYTDVYQVGVLVYELVTGELPFEGPSPAGTVTAILNKEITPPSAVDPTLPPDVDEVVLNCLARQKDQRYESVLYLRDELEDILLSL